MADDNALASNLRDRLDAALEAAGWPSDTDLDDFYCHVYQYLFNPPGDPGARIDRILERLRFRFVTAPEVRLLHARKASLEQARTGEVQSVRSAAAIHLMDVCDLALADWKKRRLAKLVLDDRVDRLQGGYRRIVKEHHRIKKTFLTPV
jgi:hypothetical protein